MHDPIGLIILSLFCGGGLFAYAREALRLRRLIASGTVAHATVLKKERINSGSESVVLFLVTYEFVDDRGNAVVHEQDVNSWRFFGSLSVGDKMEVMFRNGRTGNSYPLGRIHTEKRIAQWIAAGILLFWGVMGTILVHMEL